MNGKNVINETRRRAQGRIPAGFRYRTNHLLRRANPSYDQLVSNIFNRVASGEIDGWTSVISLSEVLVQPISLGRTDLQQEYREFLLKSANFHTVPISATVAEGAARIRASYGLRIPDASK